MRSKRFTVLNLNENYIGTGTHTFKVVLNPKVPLEVGSFEMVDSSRRPLQFRVRKWGTKVNVEFDVTEDVHDGVACFFFETSDHRGKSQRDMVKMWIIK